MKSLPLGNSMAFHPSAILRLVDNVTLGSLTTHHMVCVYLVFPAYFLVIVMWHLELTKVLTFTEKGLDHIAEKILGYLDAKSLCAAEQVCKEWGRVISDGMLWKKLIEHMVRTDDLWRGLAERKGW